MKDIMEYFVSIIKRVPKDFLLIKRLGSCKGFNLVELMIVVAIVGILAAISVPLYSGYIQKSRVKSLVYPGLHIIESNVGLYYAMNATMPDNSNLSAMWAEADTTYFTVNLPGDRLEITIDSPNATSKLFKLDGMELILTPVATGNKISSWKLSGELAIKLGIDTD